MKEIKEITETIEILKKYKSDMVSRKIIENMGIKRLSIVVPYFLSCVSTVISQLELVNQFDSIVAHKEYVMERFLRKLLPYMTIHNLKSDIGQFKVGLRNSISTYRLQKIDVLSEYIDSDDLVKIFDWLEDNEESSKKVIQKIWDEESQGEE